MSRVYFSRHLTKEFEDYHYLAGQLKVHCKGFESLRSYGTDGEINLVNAFICELPESLHLRCKIPLADNIGRKLKALSFGKDARQQFLYNVRNRKKLSDPYLLVGNNLPQSAGKKSGGERRKEKPNETRPPLMTIRNRSSSSRTAATARNTVDSFAVASALMALSGSTPSNEENFALKELAGT